MPSDSVNASTLAVKPTGLILAAMAFFGVLLIPADMEPTAQRVAAVAVLMAILWLSQAVDLAVTALLPMVLFPLMGVATAAAVSKSYMSSNIALFMGGFVIALGIEHWGLHKRIALVIVSRSGSGLKRIMLGFMFACSFLSMWISNTATTLMMLPIGLGLVSSLREAARHHAASNSNLALEADSDRMLDQFTVRLMLGIAYSATIGGLCTYVGTLPNLVFAEQWRKSFPDKPEISAGEWMICVIPIAIGILFTAWFTLIAGLKDLPPEQRFGKSFFRDELHRLGPWTKPERRMFGVFVITAILWMTRKPIEATAFTIPGWGPLASSLLAKLGTDAAIAKKAIDDSTVAVVMAVSTFVLPAGLRRSSGPQHHKSHPESNAAEQPQAKEVGYRPLMDWPTASRIPWGILILFSGGLALAEQFGSSGLSQWLGNGVASMIEGWPAWLMITTICLGVTFLTELTSNTATTLTLLPILAGTAGALGVPPLLIMIPATLSASCAFMLPVATPPNAIVFGSGKVTIRQMATGGIVLNLLAAIWLVLGTLFWIGPRLGI